MNPSVDYGRYQTLNITRRGAQGAVLDVQMKARNGKLPTAGHDGHAELTEIWRDIGRDETVRAAVLRGEGYEVAQEPTPEAVIAKVVGRG